RERKADGNRVHQSFLAVGMPVPAVRGRRTSAKGDRPEAGSWKARGEGGKGGVGLEAGTGGFLTTTTRRAQRTPRRKPKGPEAAREARGRSEPFRLRRGVRCARRVVVVRKPP